MRIIFVALLILNVFISTRNNLSHAMMQQDSLSLTENNTYKKSNNILLGLDEPIVVNILNKLDKKSLLNSIASCKTLFRISFDPRINLVHCIVEEDVENYKNTIIASPSFIGYRNLILYLTLPQLSQLMIKPISNQINVQIKLYNLSHNNLTDNMITDLVNMVNFLSVNNNTVGLHLEGSSKFEESSESDTEPNAARAVLSLLNRPKRAIPILKNVDELHHLIASNNRLTTLALAYLPNFLGSIKDFSDAIKMNSSIISLRLSKSNPYAKKQITVIEVAEILKTNKNIAELSLRGTQINDKNSIEKLAQGLESNTTIKVLDLSETAINCVDLENQEWIKIILTALTHNSNLTSINLASGLRNNEAQCIAEWLKYNKILISINLENNSIKAEGALAIAEALKTNQTLRVLELGNNVIKDKGTRELAEAIRLNKSLTALGLNQNKIKGDGTKALVKLLQENKNLTSIRLMDNPLSEEVIEILEMLKVSNNIKQISMGMQCTGIPLYHIPDSHNSLFSELKKAGKLISREVSIEDKELRRVNGFNTLVRKINECINKMVH